MIHTTYCVEFAIPDKVYAAFGTTDVYQKRVLHAFRRAIKSGSRIEFHGGGEVVVEWGDFTDGGAALDCDEYMRNVLAHYRRKLSLGETP